MFEYYNWENPKAVQRKGKKPEEVIWANENINRSQIKLI